MVNKQNQNVNRQNDLYNVDEYRKKKQMKKFVKKSLIILAIIIMILLIVFTIEGIKQKIDSHKTTDITYPINLKGENPMDLDVVDGNIIVLGEAKNIFYSESAKKTGEIVHRNVNPLVKVNGNRVLTYEPNGYNLRVDYKSETIGELKFDNKILFAEINERGYVAVVTFEDRFNGVLTIYNPSLEEVYKYSENKNYITSFDFAGNKNGILTMQTTQDGKMSSVVRLLDFQKEKDTLLFEKQFIGEVVYDTYYKNEKVYAYTDRAVVILDKKGKEISRYELEGDLIRVEQVSDKSILYLQDMVDSSKTNLYVLDGENNIVANTSFNGKLKDVYYTSNRIVVLTDQSILKYNYELELLDTFENDKGLSSVCIVNEQIYAVNGDYLYRIEKEKVE